MHHDIASLAACGNHSADHLFHFRPVSVADSHRALRQRNTNTTAGPETLNLFILYFAADVSAEPWACFMRNNSAKVWKSAFILLLLKGGDPSYLNNYRAISKVCILAKVFEKIVNNGLDEFLEVNDILSAYQSGFMKGTALLLQTLKFIMIRQLVVQKKEKKTFYHFLLINQKH